MEDRSLQPGAAPEFVDRRDAIEQFKTLLASSSTIAAGRVLVWHGPGGQGKTALRIQMQKMVEDKKAYPRIAVGVLDFAVPRHRDPVDALLHLRADLASIRFPRFDLAFTYLFASERPGADIHAIHPELFIREHELVGDLLQVAAPGADVVFKWTRHLRDKLLNWLTKQELKTEWQEIERSTSTRLRERLADYFARDLCSAMQSGAPIRVVLLIDAYETLRYDSPATTTRAHDWVASLIGNTRGAVVAIFGRSELSQQAFPNKCPIENIPLDALPQADAEDFLMRNGIDSAAVRTRILTVAHGLPYSLVLALEEFQRIKKNAGRVPVPDDFAETPDEVPKRFLSHLSDLEVIELRLASYPEEIDEDLWYDLCSTFGVAAHANWTAFKQISCVTQLGDRVRMHALMREALQEREEARFGRLFIRVHKWLSERYRAYAVSAQTLRDINESHEHALLKAAHHLAKADRLRLAAWILDPQWTVFYDAGRWRALALVFELIDEKVGTLPPGDRNADAVWFPHHYAHVRQYMGQFPEAKALFERAANAYPEDASTCEPKYATILDALANVCWELGNAHREEAELLYAKARAIYEAAPAADYAVRHAYATFKLARFHDQNERQKEAETLFQKARELFEALGTKRREFPGFLVDLARIRRDQGRDKEALEMFKEALAAYSGPIGDPGGCAVVLLDLAECFAGRGDRASASAHFVQAVSAHEDAFGAEHPNLGRALDRQAAFWLEDDPRTSEAAAQLTRAVEILSESLGDEHVWTHEARADLGRAQQARFAPG